MSAERPTVAVWKQDWLPHSETFIRNQLTSLSRWTPLRIGRLQTDDPLVRPDYAPFNDGLVSKVAWRAGGPAMFRTGYSRVLRQHRARLIHAHFGSGGMEAAPLARRAGIPLVVTFHGSDVTVRSVVGEVGSRRHAAMQQMFEAAGMLVAVSEFIRGRLITLGADPGKIEVHHIGIPIADLPTGADRPREGVLFVGRLTAKKGVADLLDAMAALPERVRMQTSVKIVGDGPLRSDLERQARGTGVRASFLGRRTSSEVNALMASSAVFCAPSQTAPDGDAEGFGMVFLEAALNGLPAAAYRHGGVCEAVQDGRTGLLADPGDVAGLGRNLLMLLDTPDLGRRLGEAGRLRVRRDFDVVRQTAQLEHLYDALAGTPAAAPLNSWPRQDQRM